MVGNIATIISFLVLVLTFVIEKLLTILTFRLFGVLSISNNSEYTQF